MKKEPLRREAGNTLVLFIHGLSGSAYGTWEQMHRAFVQDNDLRDYSFDSYTYPTSLIQIPFFSRRKATIQDIANGLCTQINTHFCDKKEIILVCHSLGGIIARQYILDEKKQANLSKISGIIFFATPHTGSALANIGKLFSFTQRHLKQLCKGAEILEFINSDWVKLKIEDQIRTLYVVGGSDKVVAVKSAAPPYISAENVKTLINYGHTEVIKPLDKSDTRFKVLKNFIFHQPSTNILNSNHTHEQGDVLFDCYSLASEKFYIQRQEDKTIQQATQSANIWVCGSAGIGKTVSLRRLAEISGWDLHHIFLDSFQNLGALELMREVCNILFERAGSKHGSLPKDISLSSLVSYFHRAFSLLKKLSPIAILIEEIPLLPGETYSDFLDVVYSLSNSTESNQSIRVIWLFSSIRDPRVDVRRGNVKILERIQFIEYIKWQNNDCLLLNNLIVSELNFPVDRQNIEFVIDKSKGSPRFIKMLYRRMRNEVGQRTNLNELISSVEKDLS